MVTNFEAALDLILDVESSNNDMMSGMFMLYAFIKITEVYVRESNNGH